MKKIISLILVLILVFSVIACSKPTEEEKAKEIVEKVNNSNNGSTLSINVVDKKAVAKFDNPEFLKNSLKILKERNEIAWQRFKNNSNRLHSDISKNLSNNYTLDIMAVENGKEYLLLRYDPNGTISKDMMKDLISEDKAKTKKEKAEKNKNLIYRDGKIDSANTFTKDRKKIMGKYLLVRLDKHKVEDINKKDLEEFYKNEGYKNDYKYILIALDNGTCLVSFKHTDYMFTELMKLDAYLDYLDSPDSQIGSLEFKKDGTAYIEKYK